MGKSRILVIDDDTDFLEMTGGFLEGPYEVSLARSGEQALEYLAGASPPDLILLDVDMPGMDGYEAIKRIHALEGMAGTPVIFLTGMTAAESELKGLELGAVDYIVKPFVKEILLKRLEVRLKQGKELRALYRERRTRKKPDPLNPLTPWERKIALLAQRRLSGAEIAEGLNTTGGTIRTALTIIYSKLGVHSKRELADFDFET